MANDAFMAAPTARRPFVGRLRELEELENAFADAGAGRGALFLLVGSAGIGKTRLADEAARGAAAAGLKVSWGRCWETGGAPAYWPFIQVLREVVRGPDGAALVAGLGTRAQLLAPLLPELVSDQGNLGHQDPDPVQARFRLFEAAVALLRAAAEQTPLFVVLDDLHAADPSSLALLHFIARNLRGLRVLIVGTYRAEEARLSPEVSRVLTDVAREGAYLPVPPLTRDEIAALVASAAEGRANANLAEAVHRATEGNPLFVNELLRLLVARGDFALGRDEASLPIPDTVREVIGRRIGRLAPETRTLLGTASVIGRDFAASLLGSIAADPPADLGRRLEEAANAGLLQASGPGVWRFSHVLVREGLYRELDTGERARLHQAVAGRLKGSGRENMAVAEIAHHLLAALPAGDAVAAADAARRAAERAIAMLAFEDAAVLLGRAHEALQSSANPDPRALCELRLLAGMAFMRAGEVARGRAACVTAADAARALGAGDLLARSALTYGAELMLAITDPKLVALLEEARSLLPPGPSGLRAQVLARLAAALQPARDVQGPIAMAREAIAMAREAGDDSVLRSVLLFAGSAMADYAPAKERVAVAEELSRLAQAAGDRFALLRAESRLTFDCLEMGALARARQAIDRYETVAQEFNQNRHIWPGRLMRSMLASAEGRGDEATRCYDEAAGLAEGDPDPTVGFVFAYCLLGHALEGDRPETMVRAEAALEAIARITEVASEDPLVLAQLGRIALRARAGDAATVRHELKSFPFDYPLMVADGAANVAMVEAAALIDEPSLSAELYRRLSPFSGGIACHGRAGMCCGGPFDLSLGILATLLGREAEAERHFEAALALSKDAGLRPYQAQGKYWYARFLRRRSRPGDRERTATLVKEALTLAEGLGMAGLCERLQALGHPESALTAPVAPVAPAAPPSLAQSLAFMAEGDYWTVSAGAVVCRLRDSRGVQMLAQLVANPGREYHVLALSGAGDEADRGDAGEALDAEAIAEYRARLEELDDEIAEAESWADAARLSRAREEREAIGRELAHGVGLGGKVRRLGGAAERARTNVQRRIRGAIRKIEEVQPALGTYLERTVRTGTFCAYEPM
jgi:tetratricopeptide (TPR) repeat protein